jgi:hypothetical protein
MTAMSNKFKGDGKSSDKELTGRDWVLMLYASDQEMDDVLSAFKEVLINANHCKIEGNVELNPHLFSKISGDDLDMLLGEYLALFLLSSWTKYLNQN